MPEYLAPGVYIEETSFRAKSIEGVSTSTAGFVGPARYGPPEGLPELVTSFAEFERIFGGLDRLQHEGGDGLTHNYLAHGVRAFFDNGGSRLYVARAYRRGEAPDREDGESEDAYELRRLEFRRTYGRANGRIAEGLTVRARFPGSAGEDMRVALTLRLGGNVLAEEDGFAVLRGVNPGDVVWVSDVGSPAGSLPTGGNLYRAERYFDEVGRRTSWRLRNRELGDFAWEVRGLARAEGDRVHPLTASVEVVHFDRTGRVVRSESWEDLGFDPETRHSLGLVFQEELPNRSQQLRVPIVVEAGGASGTEIARRLLEAMELSPDADLPALTAQRVYGLQVALSGGSDGEAPTPADYAGDATDPRAKTGLAAFEDLADVSIVAAPGYSAGGNRDDAAMTRTQAVTDALISHAERMKYRIAVLDAADGQSLADVRAQRAQIDSSHAALYFPWVRILDPITGQEVDLPPSGFVAGIYARNDVENGVHKAPANETVRGAVRFEVMLNKAQQDVLNPLGINCFRFFEGRGYRLWGARTVSSDPEWKYVNLRRYFAYLERSIELGTQWAVFENNSEPLWANVRRTIEDFLFNEWKSGRLMGEKPAEAFFVRCDRSTMTQNDIDNGRLICLIGVSPVRPAEFVIFRIGQWVGTRQA